MEELRTRFGGLVAAHRRRLGLTQDALAGLAGISVDMISRIESGATGARFPTISKLAEALGVDAGELFSPHVPSGGLDRQPLTKLTTKLAKLSEKDLAWIDQLLDVALRRR